ncbi:MAG: energy transducer TonB [Pyrinomonadaceae bacterium]
MSAFAYGKEARRINVAVLDFGETQTGARVADALSRALAADAQLALMDRALTRAAAHGAGYAGSLNMTLEEARDLGASIGCDFFITGDAQTLRRSPSAAPAYFEAYASIFIVSAASGKLVLWERTHTEAASPAEAEKNLLAEITHRNAARDVRTLIDTARDEATEKRARLAATLSAEQKIVFEDAPAGDTPAAKDFQVPQPYRRLRPAYPETAAQADAEATVDVLVSIDASGEVAEAQVTRWAGFGLDEAALAVIRQLHFRPAQRNASPVPVRVLLRYNFRRPPRSK